MATTMLRRRTTLSCHFCNSSVLAKDPTNFRCPHCNCLNRFVNGNLVDPAMFDESMQSRVFVKRGNDRLPEEFGRPNIFCHDCQRNATLVVQLLANYVEGPEDENRIDEYRESLYSRYPLVCDSCRAQVDAEIRKKDAMARSKALGGWLNQTKGKVKQRHVVEGEKLSPELFIWRLRGCLWVTTALTSILSNAVAAFGWWPVTFKSPMLLLCVNVVSVFWSFWNPTYSSFRSAKLQGRDVRVRGKRYHITLQLLSWITRLIASLIVYGYSPHLSLPSIRSRIYFSFNAIIQLLTAVLPFFVLRLQQPPAIRLIDTTTHKLDSVRSPSQTPVAGTSTLEPELFAGLSFSSNPIRASPRKAPVFGESSMPSSLISPGEHVSDVDEMDVDTPVLVKGKQVETLWLRPQRFFAPEAPTGLESLFEQTKIADEDVTMGDVASSTTPSWKWWWVYAPALLVLAGLVYKALASSKNVALSHPLPTIPPASFQ